MSSFDSVMRMVRENVEFYRNADLGRGKTARIWNEFVDASNANVPGVAKEKYNELVRMSMTDPKNPTNMAARAMEVLRTIRPPGQNIPTGFVSTPDTDPFRLVVREPTNQDQTLSVPTAQFEDKTKDYELASRESRLRGEAPLAIIPPHAGLDAQPSSQQQPQPRSFSDTLRDLYNKAPTITSSQKAEVISAPPAAPASVVTPIPPSLGKRADIRQAPIVPTSSAIPKEVDDMIDLMNKNAENIIKNIPASASNTRELAKELRDAAASGDKGTVRSLMQELSGPGSDRAIFGDALKKSGQNTGVLPQSFADAAKMLPKTAKKSYSTEVDFGDLPDSSERRSIPGRIYDYLRERGRDISFNSVKELASKYKGPILGLVGVAAAAAIIYGAYRLYKYIKPGVIGAPGPSSLPGPRPTPVPVPPQVLSGTIKEILDALAAEFPWIRENIGTARSILVNGFEAGKFERAVESIVERAVAALPKAQEGRGIRSKKRAHRGAGVMMV